MEAALAIKILLGLAFAIWVFRWLRSRPNSASVAAENKLRNATSEPVSVVPQDATKRTPVATKSAIFPADTEITDEFKRAIELANRRESFFVCGRAGTGKSTLLRCIRNAVNGNIAVVAPTGLAAVNVGGQTIHSFFRLPPQLIDPDTIKQSRHAALYKKLDFLVIDEVSMVRVDLMVGIDRALRVNRGRPNEPFGGVCVIMFGDLHQLPPIVADGEVRGYLQNKYGGTYFFNAPVFKQREFRYLELTKKFRQKDPIFSNFLDCVADHTVDEPQLEALKPLVRPLESLSGNDDYTILAPHNDTVFEINNNFLSKLTGHEFLSDAAVTGTFDKSSYPTDASLLLKVGAKVVLLRNDPSKRWVNGTIATVSKLSKSGVWIEVRGTVYELEKATWEKIKYEYDPEKQKIVQKVIGTFRQFPLRLAWALTIHKSQGMTLDKVYIDLARGAFAHGQTYVALSRCRSLDGLAFGRPLAMSDIIFDPDAVSYRQLLRPVN